MNLVKWGTSGIAVVIAGAAITLGVTQFTGAAQAADPTPTPPAASQGAPGPNGTFASNEDATHEAAESPEQEAAENSGQAFHGGRGGKPNEDAAHEKAETAAQEAAEDAGQVPSGQTPSTAPSPAR